jgi:hypothetical protein
MQVFVEGILFKGVAAIGALMVISCMSLVVLALFRKDAA